MARAFYPHHITDDSALGGMEIKRSWRVEQGTADVNSGSNFYRTFGSGNRRTFTTSVWVKKCDTPGNIGDDQYAIFTAGGGGSGSSSLHLYFYNDDRLQYSGGISGSASFDLRTDRRFRDTCNWYHIVAAVDSTAITSSDRVKLYVNGVQQTNLQTASYPSQNGEMYFNYGIRHRIGSFSIWSNMANTYGNFNGYMADMYFIDGAQLTPASFGYTDTMTGMWRPKRFKFATDIPNKTTRTYSGTFTASGNGFGSNPTTNAFNGNISNGFNNSAGGQIITWNTSTYNLSGNVRIYGRGDAYDVYVNGNATKVADMPSSNGWVDLGTHEKINEIQWAGTTYNTADGLGSAGVHVNAIIVDGVWLRDNLSEFGTNGFWLDFRDNTSTTTLGYDYSGNGNHFTPDEVSVSGWEGNDSFIDTPTNNFPMLNIESIYKVHNNTSDIYNGALKYNCHYDNQGSCPCSMAFPTSGKWYFEVKLLTSNSNATFGIVPALWSQDHNAVQETGARMYAAYGQYFVNGTNTSGVNGWGTSDTVAAALDMDEKKITFYKNNSVEITLALESGYENVPYLPILTGGTNGGSVNLGINFGANESWTYTPPAGFKSLCTNNLPPSASSPILKPQAHFDTVLWTGNGGTSQTVTGLEFQPDFVWVKGRSTAAWNRLQNSVVGANKLLYSNASNAEATDEANGYVSEFTSSGFQLADPGGNGGGVNASGETYAAWCWKAGGTAVSNSDGTIASQVSVNQDAGFSIVSYTGDGNATATIGHGLGKKPKWIITKCRSTATQADWVVWHEDLDDNKNVFLDKTNAQSTPSYGHITDPTSTLINVTKSSGNQTNASGQTYISYCWAEIPGYSKFSSYVGDGNNDGPFIHMGFSPAFLLLKCVGSSANWVLIDIKRNGYTSGGAPSEGNFENFKTLCPNLNNAENASGGTTNDVVSNGFKIRGGTDRNISGQKHIYAAFADFPDSTAYDTEPNAR